MARLARSRREIFATNHTPLYEVAASRGNQPLRTRRGGIPVWAWGCGFFAGMVTIGICAMTFLTSYVIFCAADPDLRQSVVRRVSALSQVCSVTRGNAEIAAIPTVDPILASTQAARALNTTPTPAQGVRAATITPTFRATATVEPLPVNFQVQNFKWEPQRWNNCGPANTVQGLHLIGYDTTQADAAAYLKPNKNDANVSPWQMADFINAKGDVRALVRVNGNLLLLKRLVYAGFGTLAETGLYSPDDGSWEGHYLTMIGWDDRAGQFDGLDSLQNLPQGVREEYTDFDTRWAHFNRVYLVLYRPDQENKLRSILGLDWDTELNIQGALDTALRESTQNAANAFAWFNAGSSYLALGQNDQAAAMYDKAFSINKGLPWRMLWYQFGPYKAYFEAGQYQRVIDLANATLRVTQYVEETFYYRAAAYAALGRTAEAQADLQAAISFNPYFSPAQELLNSLLGGTAAKPRVL